MEMKCHARCYTRDELVERLVRAGELEISGEDHDEVDTYFDTENFIFHGPDGFDADYAGLTGYFQSLRAAFDDRTIRRGIIVAEGEYIACQPRWIDGCAATRQRRKRPHMHVMPLTGRSSWSGDLHGERPSQPHPLSIGAAVSPDRGRPQATVITERGWVTGYERTRFSIGLFLKARRLWGGAT
jgi:hypothetical protein